MRKTLALLLLLSSTLSSPLSAQTMCADRATILHGLFTKHGEVPTAMGLSSDGGVLELLVDPDNHGWTLLITYPKRPTCVVAVGKFWENLTILKGQAS